ncbi:MAG: hypothetical protein DWQ36_18975 [Acidobacteria bacterium]|nr:MAG: hypothetical protein DWQ30_18040 [Acidobacteriota bacterium]REK03856.1 MAG: hypothetical protein DWQ36_18975 [Acidobacteriota bacterium]
MTRTTVALLLLSVLVLPSTLFADGQETGVIVGRVTDPSGIALPGVVVSAEAGRGAKEAVTDENGEFRFALLVPGEYTVTAAMDGFEPTGVRAQVSGGGKAEVTIVLSMGTAETITVTSELPMVDKFNVTAGSTVTSEVGEQTAGSTRTYYGVINTLPGVTSDSENNAIQQTRPSVNGSTWADQQVFIDGVDTSFARYGGSRVYIPTTAVTEVTMEAGGASAEYGRAVGSTTNVIVKSGTNQVHGGVAVQYQTVDWASDYDSQPALLRRENTPVAPDFLRRSAAEEDNDSTGYELSIGGPLARDKAWYFLAWSDFDTNDTDQTRNNDPVDISLGTEARIAKLNFQPADAHAISLSWIDTPADRFYSHVAANDYWSPTYFISEGTLGTATWNYSISSDFFLETKVAIQQSDENKLLACQSFDPAECLQAKAADRGPDGEGALRYPPNPALGIHYPGNNFDVYRDSENDGAWNNGWLLDNGFGVNEFPRDQANASLTQFAGSNHEIKYGVDWQQTEWDANIQALDVYDGPFFNALHPFGFSAATGNILEGNCGVARTDGATVAFLNSIGIPAGRAETCAWTVVPSNLQVGSGQTQNEDLAFYLRDRFSVGDHWTFNLGLRYENAEASNDIGRTVVDSDNFAPRLSAVYDVKGDGRVLLSANVGRYYAQLNQQWLQEHLRDQPNGEIASDQDTYLFCDAIDVQLGLCSGVGYNFLLRSLRSGRMWELVDQGIFQSEIDPYYKDEVILGFEWQLARNWALDTKLIWWELGDMIGATIQASPFGDQFKLTANYEDYPSILAAIDAARVAAGGPALFANDILSSYQEGKMEYQAIQIQLNRRFAGDWALFNNVTLSETETTGSGSWDNNTNSDYGEDLHVVLTQDHIAECNEDQATRTVPISCDGLSRFLGQPVSTINRFGSANNIDRPVIWNTFGFKTFRFGSNSFTLGGHLNFQSGLPWQRNESISTISLDGNTAANASVTLYPEGRGARRLDDIYTLNLSAAWNFPIFREVGGQLRIEGLNVTDQQEQVDITSRGEVRPVRRDFQRPRQVRASFTLSF